MVKESEMFATKLASRVSFSGIACSGGACSGSETLLRRVRVLPVVAAAADSCPSFLTVAEHLFYLVQHSPGVLFSFCFLLFS